MRILLINPVFPPSLWDFSLSRDIEGTRYTHPPLALPTVAAVTPPGHDITIVDENVSPIDMDADADVVGITGYWIQRERVFELADAFRAAGRIVVLGGPLVGESTVDECARHADAVFIGEAEYTWPRYLADLEAGRPSARYVQRELIDMHDSPLPRFDLLDLGAYSTATSETSRGCPYSCEFCEIPSRLGKRSRTKSVEQILAEVKQLYALGADSIFFIDDHFIGNRGHTLRLLAALTEFVHAVDYRIYFTCQFTINVARDTELLEALVKANFRRVFVGLETPRKKSLLALHKKQNLPGDLVENVRTVQRYGITVWAGLIVGLDGDDVAVFDEQQALLRDAAIPMAMIGLLQAIPGTPLYDRMQRVGRLREVDMSGVRGTYDSLVRSNITPPPGMTQEELVRGYQRLIRDAYDYDRFGERLVDSLLLADRRPPSAPAKMPQWKRLRIVLALLRHYLFTRDQRRRRMFSKVMGRILRERPHQLEAALMHLVVYKHMRLFYGRVADLPLPESAPQLLAASMA